MRFQNQLMRANVGYGCCTRASGVLPPRGLASMGKVGEHGEHLVCEEWERGGRDVEGCWSLMSLSGQLDWLRKL